MRVGLCLIVTFGVVMYAGLKLGRHDLFLLYLVMTELQICIVLFVSQIL